MQHLLTGARTIIAAAARGHRPTNVSVDRALILLLALLFYTPTYVAAQTDPVANDVFNNKGLQASRNFFSPEPWEHLDPMSGNVVLTFTDLTLPGNNNHPLVFQRTYNSQYSLLPELGPAPISRWTFGFPGIVMRIVEKPLRPQGYPWPADLVYAASIEAPILWYADGSYERTMWEAPPATSQANQRWVRSPRFYRYDRDATVRQILMPDGRRTTYDAEGRLIGIYDQYANVTTLTYDIDGSNNGTITVRDQPSTAEERVVVWTVEAGRIVGMDVGDRHWEYSYEPSGLGGDISHVSLPEGSAGWTFTYDSGDLRSIETPSHGVIEHVYVNQWVYDPAHLYDDCCRQEARFLRYRRTYEQNVMTGEWNIQYGEFGSNFATAMTVVGPTAQVTYQHATLTTEPGRLIGGRVGVFQVDVGPPNGPPTETTNFTYEAVKTVSHSTNVWWGTSEVKTRSIQRGAETYSTTFTYNSTNFGDYHRPASVAEAHGALTRNTTNVYTHYTTPNYVVGLPYTQTVQVGSDVWTRSWDYTNKGKPTFVREWHTGAVRTGGYGTTLEYDATTGNLSAQWIDANKKTFYQYQYGQVRETQTPEYTTLRVINPDGTVASETEAGRTTTFSYDKLGRVTQQQPPGDVAPITTTYDLANASWMRVTQGSSFTQTTLDGFGRPIATVDALGVQTKTTYDAEGRVSASTPPFVPGVGAGEVYETLTYDEFGRITSRTHPDGSDVTYGYAGITTTITDENDHPTLQAWQAFGNPDDARLIMVTDATAHTWTYTYDAIGHLTRVQGPEGPARQWTYTSANRVASEQHPESGTTTFTYGSTGLVSLKTDARATAFVYTYDANDRVLSVTAANRVTRFEYEPGSDRRVLASVGPKENSGVVIAPLVTRFLYDDAGRMAGRQDLIDGRTFTSWVNYGPQGNVTALTYPALDDTTRRQIDFDYESTQTRLTSVTDQGTGRTYADTFSYHPSGAVTSVRAGNGLVTTLTYDPYRYWVRSIQAGALGLGYDEYDGVGNLKQLTDSRGQHQTFGYDVLDRLTTASGAYGSLTFAYDVHGNRTTVPGVATYTYDPVTLRLTEQNGSSLTYDPNGNLRTQPGRAYDYTADNMVETATVDGVATIYRYDADGWRIAKTAGGTTTYYLRGPGHELLTEWRTPGPTGSTKDYIYAGSGGRLLAAVDTTVASGTLPGGTLAVGGAPSEITLAANQDARFVFSATAGQTVRVTLTRPTPLDCNWTLTVLTPTGASLGSDGPCAGTTAAVTVSIPTSGLYVALVHPANGASGLVTVSAANVGSGAASITGLSPLLGAPGSAVTISGAGLTPTLSVRFNSTLASASGGPTSLTATVPVGAMSGRIQVVTPLGTATSPMDFFVPPPGYTAAAVAVTGHLTLGALTTVTLPASKIALLTVDLQAGQRFLTRFTNVNASYYQHATVYRPDGDVLWQSGALYVGASVIDPLTAPVAGTYTFMVIGDYAGTSTVTLIDVPQDLASGSIPMTGAAFTVGPLVAGQNARLTFTGTQGQRIQLTEDSQTFLHVWVTILAADGTVLLSQGSYGAGEFTGPLTLPLTGTYQILVNPASDYTGTMVLRLYDVPPDPVIPITTDGTPATITMTAPYQTGYLEFSATAGQRLLVAFSNMTIPTSPWTLSHVLAPSGVVAFGSSYAIGNGIVHGPTTVTETGVYRVRINPGGTLTGAITVQVYQVPADLTGTITLGGPPVTTAFSTPGQTALDTFSGTAGQKVSAQWTGGTFSSSCGLYLYWYQPPNLNAWGGSTCAGTSGFYDTFTLPATGTYAIKLAEQGAATGNVTIQLFDATDITGTIAMDVPVTTALSTPGRSAFYTFAGTAGQKISAQWTNGTFATSCGLYLYWYQPPNLNAWGGATCAGTSGYTDTFTLPATGTYAIKLDPQGAVTGNQTFTMFDVTTDVTAALTVNAAATTMTIPSPGQNAQPTFTGTAGQVHTVRITGNAIGSVAVSLIKPDGTTMTTTTSSATSFNLSSQTLPVAGVYKVRVNPSGAATGSIGVQVTQP